MTDRIARMIAVFFGAGVLRPAPGTWGSLAGVAAAVVLHALCGPLGLGLGIGVAFFAGWWATAQMTRGKDNHDPSEIVIDEVAGQWIALLPVSIGAAHAGVGIFALWPGIVVAFLGFRLFDILKPGPVGWADRRHDAFGVMFDDVIAGVLAAVLVVACAAFAHGVARF